MNSLIIRTGRAVDDGAIFCGVKRHAKPKLYISFDPNGVVRPNAAHGAPDDLDVGNRVRPSAAQVGRSPKAA